MLPETGTHETFRDALFVHLPLWELCDTLWEEGIAVHHFNYRPSGLVMLEVSWHMAHEKWGHVMTAVAIRDLIVADCMRQGYDFMRWELKEPNRKLWLETMDRVSKEARVYLRPQKEEEKDGVEQRAAGRLIAKVNENILARHFKMSEEAGVHDRD